MNSNQPDIVDVFAGLEEFQRGNVSIGDPPRDRDWWWRTCRIWLFALVIDALLLLVVVMLVERRSHGRGARGSSDGIFLSASFSTASGSGVGEEVDTTIPDEEAQKIGTASELLGASRIRPLLTLVPTDPESVFDSPSSEPLTTESQAFESDTQNSSATQRRPRPEQRTTSVASATDLRDITSVEADSQDESTQTPFRQNRAMGGRGIPGVGNDGDSVGNGASGGKSDGDGTAFFGIAARAQRFVFVVDASESMREHGAMQTAKKELWQSLQQLSAPVKFQLVFFNLKSQSITRRGERPQMLSANEANLRMAQQFLKGIQPDSGTDRFGALSFALSLGPDVVFLLTDSDTPELSAKELSDIRRLNRSRAVIHVVEFGKGADLGRDNFLKAIARQHGGTYRYFDLMRESDH